MIAVIDYDMGNLRSVAKAIEKVGGHPLVTSRPADLKTAEKIVLPGVGAFGDAAKNLADKGLFEALVENIRAGKYFLGICLGLQLLQEASEESPAWVKGLGLIPGTVERFPNVDASGGRIKVPHIGWNQVYPGKAVNPVSKGVSPGAYFYFVHSYYVLPQDENLVALWCGYGDVRFAAMVAWNNVYATQFHPEKSQSEGLALLKRFVEL